MKHFFIGLVVASSCLLATPAFCDSTNDNELLLKEGITREFALEFKNGLGRLFFHLGDRLFFVEQTQLTGLIQQEGLVPVKEGALAECVLYDQYTTSATYWAKIKGNQLYFYKDARPFHTYSLSTPFLESIEQAPAQAVDQSLKRQFILYQFGDTQRLLLEIDEELLIIDDTKAYRKVEAQATDQASHLAKAQLLLKADSSAYEIWSEIRGKEVVVYSPLFASPKRFPIEGSLAEKWLAKNEASTAEEAPTTPLPPDWVRTILHVPAQLHLPPDATLLVEADSLYQLADLGRLHIEANCPDALVSFTETDVILKEKRMVSVGDHLVLQAFEQVAGQQKRVWYKLQLQAHCYTFKFELTTPVYTPERAEEMEQFELVVGSLGQE
ncbi:MAG: hypothetical protein AAF798_22735 [Bacteroidota bacterium]